MRPPTSSPDLSFAVWRAQQLSGAERRPAAWEETQDEGSAAVQLLGGVETAVSVWQEEIWRGVSDLQRVRCRLFRAANPRGGCMTPSLRR